MADENAPGDKPPEETQYNEHMKAFFLDLAAKGRNAWNEWRRADVNKGVRVTFAGIDFSVEPRDRIDFSRFEFGDFANFSGCNWNSGDSLEEEVPETSSRRNASHTDRTGTPSFFHATFGDSVNFTGASFSRAIFTGASLGQRANFTRVVFGPGTDFTGAAFGIAAHFKETQFKGRVAFNAKSKEQSIECLASVPRTGDEAHIALDKRFKAMWERLSSGPDRFLVISFERARFDGEAIFSGRSFEETANFTNAHFCFPPDFNAATNLAMIDFTGAHIGFVPPNKLFDWTTDNNVPVRLRALRKIAEETKNHDLERDLYIEERKAERGIYLFQPVKDLINELEKINRPERLNKKLEGVGGPESGTLSKGWHKVVALVLQMPGAAVIANITFARLIAHLLWIAVMAVYWSLADYGRSFVRPAAWLIASGFFFYWRYTVVLAQLMAKAPDIEKYKQAVRMLALGNTVPFVGPLTIETKIKEFLFCSGNNCSGVIIPPPPEGYQMLVLTQNLFSITLVFFIGLALRNYFKIK